MRSSTQSHGQQQINPTVGLHNKLPSASISGLSRTRHRSSENSLPSGSAF
jgi:hypothetical protein